MNGNIFYYQSFIIHFSMAAMLVIAVKAAFGIQFRSCLIIFTIYNVLCWRQIKWNDRLMRDLTKHKANLNLTSAYYRKDTKRCFLYPTQLQFTTGKTQNAAVHSNETPVYLKSLRMFTMTTSANEWTG